MKIRKGRYRHFKGNEYEVVDVARCSETDAVLVIYKPLYSDEGLWVRPLDMFLERIVRDGKEIDRFKFLS